MMWKSALARKIAFGSLVSFVATATVMAQSGGEEAARRLLLEARELERAGQSEAAQREYRLVAEQFATTTAAPEALLGLARGQREQGDTGPALNTLERLMAAYPRAPAAAGAHVLAARLHADGASNAEELRQARTLLARVPILFGPAAYGDLEWRVEARVLEGRIRLRLEEPLEAAAAFVAALEDEPPSPWTPHAGLGLAEALLAQGQWQAAAWELQRVVNLAADAEATAQARRRLTLVHRLLLAPAAGQPPWRSSRLLPLGGSALEKPRALAAAADGGLALHDAGLDEVIVLDGGGAVVARSSRKKAGRPAWRRGEVMVPAEGGVFEPLSRRSQIFFAPGSGERRRELRDLEAVARGSFGEWYLLDGDEHRVLVYGGGGGSGRVLFRREQGEATDLAMDGGGRLHVLDRKGAAVVRFAGSEDGGEVVARLGEARPLALDVDPLGNLYVLDRDGRVTVLDAAGRRLAMLGPTLPGGLALRDAQDLAVDGSGRIYVADSRLEGVVVIE